MAGRYSALSTQSTAVGTHAFFSHSVMLIQPFS